MLLACRRDLEDIAGLYAGAAMMDFLGDDLRNRFQQGCLALNAGLYRR
jgi:hypothetical protein